MDGTVLVADDDRTIRTVLTQALTRAGCKVHATSSLTTLMRWVSEGRGDAVITDVIMPDGNGLEMLPKIAQDRPELPVIVVSAQNTIMTAIKAAEAEAFDYLPKPFDLPDLMKRTARALETRQESQIKQTKRIDDVSDELPLIGQTSAMQDLYRVVARVLNAELPVIITGESGTGKSLIAKAIHDFSDRRSRPFVIVTPTDLQELEGPARIMARAMGGTIVLDEICDLDRDMQGRLVRMMDTAGEQNPRFMATSQCRLAEAGLLRDDLYYRLNGAVIDVPSLRERVDDVLLLVTHFLKMAERDGAPLRKISPGALKTLRAYSWPGNVRQLENVVHRLGLTARTNEITFDEARAVLHTQPESDTVVGRGDSENLSTSVARHLRRYFDLHGTMQPPDGLYARILHEIEVPLIEIAMDSTGGNQAKCADLLGINRNTLRKKLTELDISVTRRRKLM